MTLLTSCGEACGQEADGLGGLVAIPQLSGKDGVVVVVLWPGFLS